MDDLDVRWRQNRILLADNGIEQKAMAVIAHQ
jgi:hypothetical protein